MSAAEGAVHVPTSVPGAGIGVPARLRYWKRIFSAYLVGGQSHLTFWHGTPTVNEEADPAEVDQYWQAFIVKADYPGHHDEAGIPMLDYRGHVGLQYNPIAIAQWGLGNWNRWRREGDENRRATALRAADWCVQNLVPNEAGSTSGATTSPGSTGLRSPGGGTQRSRRGRGSRFLCGRTSIPVRRVT